MRPLDLLQKSTIYFVLDYLASASVKLCIRMGKFPVQFCNSHLPQFRDAAHIDGLLDFFLGLLGLGLLDARIGRRVQQRPQHVIGLGGLCVHGIRHG